MKGYNCSQAVLLAFADLAHLDEETALKISSSFGGRHGPHARSVRYRERHLYGGGHDLLRCGRAAAKEKSNQYAIVQELARRFKEKNGSIICRELLSGVHTDSTPVAEARTEGYYKSVRARIFATTPPRSWKIISANGASSANNFTPSVSCRIY